MFESLNARDAGRYGRANVLGLGAALGPFGGLAPGLLGQTQANPGKMELRRSGQTPPHIVTGADKLNEEFAPYLGLQQRLADIQQMREARLISPDVAEKGRNKAITDVGERMGLGGEVHMPSAALVGSGEDARLLQAFRGGNQSKETTDDLLRRILDELQKSTRETVTAVADSAYNAAVVNITP